MSATQTRAGTQTGTLSKIVYVARKVEADLLAIIDTYCYGSEQWAINVMHDVRVLMDEEVIEKIYLAWTRRGTNEVLDAYSYRVIIGGLGLADDRSGNIRYRSQLVGAEFHFRVDYKTRWWQLSPADKADIQERMVYRWTSGGVLDYSKGTWQGDKTYSKDDLGVARDRFIR
jgi:Bacterial HORMA domain family 1